MLRHPSSHAAYRELPVAPPPVLPLVLLPELPSGTLLDDGLPGDEPLGEVPGGGLESELPPMLLPVLPSDAPPVVPPVLLPPEVPPPGVLPEVPPVVPPPVPPGADVPPPGAAPVSGGGCLVEPVDELVPPDVLPPPGSELLPLPPPRLQAARLIVSSPRTNNVFDVPRLDLITIPFKSGCVDYSLD